MPVGAMLIEIQGRLAGRLLRGERILWAGQPKLGLLLVGGDVLTIPFSLLWTGGICLAAFHGAHPRFPGGELAFVPVFGAAFYMLIGRFLVDAWFRSRTYYAVTDRRVLILREGRWAAFHAISRDRLDVIELKEAGARGTIRFGQTVRRARGWGSLLPVLDPRPQFLCIEDARGVFDLLQRTRPSAAA